MNIKFSCKNSDSFQYIVNFAEEKTEYEVQIDEIQARKMRRNDEISVSFFCMSQPVVNIFI